MAITLNEVAAEDLLTRAGVLALVGIVITVVVYGAVALIVKVDDFGLALWREIIGFVPNDGQHVKLPGSQRCMVEEKPHHVADGFTRKARGKSDLLTRRGLASHFIGRIDKSIHIPFGFEFAGGLGVFVRCNRVAELVVIWRVRTFDKRSVNVDQVFDAEAGVDEILNGLDSKAIHITADAISMVSHLVDHFAIRLTEPIVVFEEVAVAINVSDYHPVVCDRVAAEKVGVTGVIVNDEFVDFLQSVGVSFGKSLVFHTETPMWIACGEATVGCDRVKLIYVDKLKDGWEVVQSVRVGVGFHFDLDVGQKLRQFFEV